MKSLIIIGTRWFQRSAGNTYHKAEIIIDGITVHKSDEHYGYGSSYEQTAIEWLQDNEYLPGSDRGFPIWRYCQENGINFQSRAIDVSRERDL